MLQTLAPRERQIVDVLYRQGEATVAEVREALPDALTASAVRAMLTRLEAKRLVARRDTPRGIVYARSIRVGGPGTATLADHLVPDPAAVVRILEWLSAGGHLGHRA